MHGPIEVRNQHPAQLTVLHMPPASGRVQPAGKVEARWDNTYSNLFLSGQGSGNAWQMDGEILRTSISTHWGLGAGLQLDAELPVGHTTGGFLDSFTIEWHDLFGFPDQGRSAAPKNRFLVQANRQGAPAFRVEEGTGLLDIPVGLTWQVVAPRESVPLGVVVRGAVEAPTGDDDRGFGSGGWDTSLGVAGSWAGDGWEAHGFFQHAWAHTPAQARRAGLRFADVTSGGLGFEGLVWPGTALLLQTEWETSTLRELAFDRVNDNQWLLWVGLRQELFDHWALELAFGEDLSEFVAPDFSAFVGLAWRP